MRVIFMGTPDFAVPCLERLIADGEDVVGVFTQPDKPKGRGHVMTPPPVKELAVKHDIPVFQPTKMKDGQAFEIIDKLDPELIIVVAYGRILPKDILERPKYGCVNIHASLLPKYRGAAPIQWAVINGEKVSGVTSMQMGEGLDTGDMLIKREVEITEEMTAGELHDILSPLGADVMSDTIKEIKAGTLKPEKQNDSDSTYASMLDKSLSPIDWSKDAAVIHNQIRGLSPWPTATTTLDSKVLKIHSSKVSDLKGKTPGEIIFNDKKLVVSCGNNTSLEILVLQAEGKKAMSADQFLLGKKIELSTELGK